MGHKYAITNGPLTIEEARALYKDTSLVPTHYALRIVPESMDQLHLLEADKSLTIQYYPFGYKLLPDPSDWIIEEKGFEPVRSLLYDRFETTCELSSDLREVSPVYVLWPISHQIPQGLNYDLLFDVYQPSSDSAINRDSSPFIDPHISGFLTCNDNRLNQYKPLAHIKIEYQGLHRHTFTTYTNENGYFVLPDINDDHAFVIKLQNDKFVIRDGETSNVKEFALDLDNYFYVNYNCDYGVDLPSNFFLDTYKAAEYYFYGENDLLDCIPIYDTLGVSIDIHAIDTPGNYLGCFYYGSNITPYINIWNYYKNNYSGASGFIFGTVNHELAHASHYAYSGAYYFYSTSTFIKESFASFVGWFNVYQYYYSLIGSSHYLVNSICSQGRQNWNPNLNEPNIYYSPFYIDLFDNYNQHTYSTNYNDDPISGVPIPFIVSSALGPQNFQAVYNILESGIGLYYTADEFSRFIASYNHFL